ncbi:MAG: RNA polymerase sigma factor [Bacteroidia bacterium]|nr:RNA polymerase sigma factor [Bacteroidia bacterium]
MDQNSLLAKIANGDRNSFRIFFDTHSELVFNVALKFARNKQDAEEITQEVFIKVFRFARNFEGKSSATTWLYRMAVNTSLNYLKKYKKGHSIESVDIAPQKFYHPGIESDHKEKANLMFELVEYLPDKQKTAFILSYVDDLPRKEVAAIMEMSLKAVESLLQRAKKKLRVNLEKIYQERRIDK